MTIYRKVERFADPQSSRTPVIKAPDPELGHAIIPKERYTSTSFRQQEWERLWTKVWLLGCSVQDLNRAGDYVVTEIGHESIVLTRDEDGGFNAFYNVCSHRGNRIAYGERGHVESFKCSYHLWEYGLKGEIKNVPDIETFPQGVPCEALAIRRLPCDTWGGWVWFSLDPNVEPLNDYLGIIPEHLDPYHFDRMQLVNDVTVEWDVNWKASVDAFNETYHVNGTHPQLMTMLEDMDVQIDCYERHNRYLIPFGCVSTHIEDGEQITPQLAGFMAANHVDPATFDGTGLDVRRAIQRRWREVAPSLGFDLDDLNDDQLTDDYHYLIFPNITLNIHATSCMLFRQRPHPDDPNKMFFDVQNYALVPSSEPTPERPAHRGFKHGEGSLGEVLDQDAHNLPMVQKGMNSAGYRGLWISNQELRIRHFHKTIDDYLFRDPVRIVD